jgi:D-aminopeptidase
MHPVSSDRRRARELGIVPGRFDPGPKNGITDVPGVHVGHTTLNRGTDIRTGVTAIVPDQLAERRSLPAGLFVGNGYGKLTGATQLVELGEIETPILLTGTLSAFRCADALVSYMLSLPGNESMTSVNPVVGETNDGFLSDIRARPITEEHVLSALHGATSAPVSEGCVGAGTGTSALGFKAGIGTSSRVIELPESEQTATIGVLVQANFSGVLTVLGVPIDREAALAGVGAADENEEAERGNSCVIVVATDAALDARQLGRLSRRAVFGMGRVGAHFTHGSGDYAIALSTSWEQSIPDGSLDPLFIAVQEAVEEAILNSLFMAETTRGYMGRVRHAVPIPLIVRS